MGIENKIKVSIIVPVYNSSSYLTVCIKSLLQQTYNNYEVLLIDDCSTDESLQICNDLAKDNPLINVIHLQQNGGVSKARNIGIENARGEFIAFVDSDDYVSNDFIENLVAPLYTEDYDIVISGLMFFEGNSNIYNAETLNPQKWFIENKKDLLNLIQQPLMTSPVSKLYKRQIIKNKNLRFDEEISLGEDRDFNIEYVSKIRSACSLAYIGYFYRRDVLCSLTKKVHKEMLKNDLIYWNKVHNLLDNVGVDYQEHRLFYFIVDNFLLLKKRKGVIAPWIEFKNVSKLIDKKFLRSNLEKVVAPLWMKFFVRILL